MLISHSEMPMLTPSTNTTSPNNEWCQLHTVQVFFFFDRQDPRLTTYNSHNRTTYLRSRIQIQIRIRDTVNR